MPATDLDGPEGRKRHRLQLPPAPPEQQAAVKAWSEPVSMLSFLPNPPDRNPLFLDRRVYQGSSGRVYPLPVIDRIATDPVEHSWQAVHLENEYLRLMVLPEIGGRIHVGLDKTNGYDFFYRQNVIKPALVGLAGPWISGGVEFNWPQHHRPATFMPVETQIERHPDGSATIWCSDYDPMTGMKGMHGVCLHPGKAYLELKVRLYNNTQFVQTFLWWANAAVRVHEKYQSFFPRDVKWVADHARRATSSFPLANGVYYGIDYGERARSGVPADELPSEFIPDETCPANDLSRYANIPVPTSYMAVGGDEDFFGGYDHAAEAGLVHIADHHVAPGKKQWTWGNQDFGYAWDRCLTEDDGPYIELMAGVYTDNQPDFSFLAPGETRTFSQFWYPIRKIGPARAATIDAALSLTVRDGRAEIGVCATRTIASAVIHLKLGEVLLKQWTTALDVAEPFMESFAVSDGIGEADLTLTIESEGETLLEHLPTQTQLKPPPVAATEPPSPDEIETSEELYLIGLHLEQYRHATRRPEIYWQEAVRRDCGDSRANNALGRWRLRRGEFLRAEGHFHRAILRLTHWNANPYDGEAFYNLGLSLRYQGREKEAYDAFAKAAWNAAWRSAALYAMAQCDAKRRRWREADAHLDQALQINGNDLNSRSLSAVMKAKLGDRSGADRRIEQTLTLDPLDIWSRYLADGAVPCSGRNLLSLALLHMSAGLWDEAATILKKGDATAKDGSSPLLLYALARCFEQLGQRELAASTYGFGASAPADYCFPSHIEEMILLEAAIAENPEDARAHYYLGNLLYNNGRHTEAIDHWEESVRLDPCFPTAWRNLGFAYFNVSKQIELAKQAFDRAMANSPDDSRILYERDQLWKRTGASSQERLAELKRHADLLDRRDDLAVELATLYNQLDAPEEALELLLKRNFQPWEGGEGLVLAQFARANLKLGQRALRSRDAMSACKFFEAVLHPPHSLGEAKHLLTNQSDLYYWLGEAYAVRGEKKQAELWWQKASRSEATFSR